MFGESGIRLASIVIGVIFIVGLVILANRFGGQIKQNLTSNSKVASATITPSVEPTASPDTFGEIVGQTQGATASVPQTAEIPKTGGEAIVIPSLISLLGVGLKLRKIN